MLRASNTASRSRLIHAALCLSLLLAAATDAEARARRKRPPRVDKKKSEPAAPAPRATKAAPDARNRIGVLGFVGYESMTIADSDPKLSMSGLGMGALGVYELQLSPSLSLPLGAGFHYVSLSGEADGVKVSMSLTSLALEGGLAYRLKPALQLAGFLGYDYGLSGEASFDLGEFGTQKYKIASSSRLAFGARALYAVTPRLGIGGDVASTSGVLKTESSEDGAEADDPANYTGMSLRALISYSF